MPLYGTVYIRRMRGIDGRTHRTQRGMKAHHDLDKRYPNQDLFDWHNRLTGSCLAGRNAFVKDRGLSLEGETSVKEFIELTESSYGGEVIRNLKKSYENRPV